jgi:hypothetical protein
MFWSDHRSLRRSYLAPRAPNATCQVVVAPRGDEATDAQGIFLAGWFDRDDQVGAVPVRTQLLP